MHSTIGQAALERANISLENSNKASDISDKPQDIANAMRLVRLAAEPRPVGDQIKPAIVRAAKRLKWKFGRTREIWYGNARRVEVREMDALRSLEREHEAVASAVDRDRHIEQLAVLRTRLHMRDAAFHQNDCAAIDWLLQQINRMG